MINPNCLSRKPSPEVSWKTGKETALNKPKKTLVCAWPGGAQQVVSGTGHCSTAVPCGARSCDFLSCFPQFFGAFFESLSFVEITHKVPFFQNPKISPESKTKHIISMIWFKGSEFDSFSTTCDMKTPRETNQIRAKIRSNIGSTNTPHLLFARHWTTQKLKLN